jgi:hypothetical protein
MRQMFLLLSVLLVGLSWAVAQDSTASPSANSGQMSQTSAGGQTTVQGCLSGSNGSYTLSDKNGTTYQLTGDTAKLSEHVGHEVKITGTSSSAADNSNASATTGAAGSQQTLQVSSVKHVSKTCSSGTNMSH